MASSWMVGSPVEAGMRMLSPVNLQLGLQEGAAAPPLEDNNSESLDLPSPHSADSLDSGVLTDTEGRQGDASRPSAELPDGWEQHQDEDGVAYYFCPRTGDITRDLPAQQAKSVELVDERVETLQQEGSRLVEPHRVEDSPHETALRFAVLSLGWLEIGEDELTADASSRAVNRCIVNLSLGRRNINDVVGRWGDGKDLLMDVDGRSLRLIDPVDLSVLHLQPIQAIRVWGVGRDNPRDFAYVARDTVTQRSMCHVFRCDGPARNVASALHQACRTMMADQRADELAGGASCPSRPSTLTLSGGSDDSRSLLDASTALFPAPMEEPRKILRCHYLGSIPVSKPSGMDVLNWAIEKLGDKASSPSWLFVDVAVAPSTITVTEHAKPDVVVEECRVRYLSFMGIGRDVRLAGMIIHTATNQFICHVFHCEPSAGALCKTIEAACKLRYQKCLDARASSPGQHGRDTASPSKKGLVRHVIDSFLQRRKTARGTEASHCQ